MLRPQKEKLWSFVFNDTLLNFGLWEGLWMIKDESVKFITPERVYGYENCERHDPRKGLCMVKDENCRQK